MWYRAGAVTLKKSTNKVLGTNTKWLDSLSNIESGQPLIVNGNIYEITEIRSDTELYTKETALADVTNGAYVIMTAVYGSLGDVALKASKALALYQEQMEVFDLMYNGKEPFTVTKADGTQIQMMPYSLLSVNLAQITDTVKQASTSASNAKTSETNAGKSATAAASSASSASASASTASTAANNAKTSENNAKTSETNAGKSATAAATSATNAKTSEANAKSYAESIDPASLFPIKPDLGTTNIDTLGTLKDAGVRRQAAAVNAKVELGYPVPEAGSLECMPSAYGCSQRYTTLVSKRVFIRSVIGAWNGVNGPWTDWSELANLNRANIFESYQEIRPTTETFLQIKSESFNSYMALKKLDGKNRSLAGRLGASFVLRNYTDNENIASQLIIDSSGSALLNNYIKGMKIGIDWTGKPVFNDQEMFHTGNAAVVNGVGSDLILLGTISYTRGTSMAMTGIDAALSGTWVVISNRAVNVAGVTNYLTQFRKRANP